MVLIPNLLRCLSCDAYCQLTLVMLRAMQVTHLARTSTGIVSTPSSVSVTQNLLLSSAVNAFAWDKGHLGPGCCDQHACHRVPCLGSLIQERQQHRSRGWLLPRMRLLRPFCMCSALFKRVMIYDSGTEASAALQEGAISCLEGDSGGMVPCAHCACNPLEIY